MACLLLDRRSGLPRCRVRREHEGFDPIGQGSIRMLLHFDGRALQSGATSAWPKHGCNHFAVVLTVRVRRKSRQNLDWMKECHCILISVKSICFNFFSRLSVGFFLQYTYREMEPESVVHDDMNASLRPAMI